MDEKVEVYEIRRFEIPQLIIRRINKQLEEGTLSSEFVAHALGLSEDSVDSFHGGFRIKLTEDEKVGAQDLIESTCVVKVEYLIERGDGTILFSSGLEEEARKALVTLSSAAVLIKKLTIGPHEEYAVLDRKRGT